MNFKKTRVINNGINIQLYNTPFFKENKEVKNILMVGRFMDTKDFSTIIKAVEILKRDERNKFHVYFAGDGNTFNTCKKFSDSLNTNSHISFLGMLDESQLIEQYCQTDLYVHSSLAETMSTSIMQALSCGIPCLVSDIPGNLSIIKDNENGWLFKTQNAEDLAEKISNLLVNKELMSEMSLKARKYAEDHLSMERMFDKYYKLVK